MYLLVCERISITSRWSLLIIKRLFGFRVEVRIFSRLINSTRERNISNNTFDQCAKMDMGENKKCSREIQNRTATKQTVYKLFRINICKFNNFSIKLKVSINIIIIFILSRGFDLTFDFGFAWIWWLILWYFRESRIQH